MSVKIDATCRYTKSHEWVRVKGSEAWAGLSDYAQGQLSDIVYCELPEEGDSFSKGDVFATVESVKAASDCYMPISGEVAEINEALTSQPELINSDPYGEGWMVKFNVSNAGELNDLMTPAAYEKYCADEAAAGGH
jgi:glycine cleavage system H protein